MLKLLMEISIFFGGNSEERGISINSARAVFDILKKTNYKIKLYYLDVYSNVYEISKEDIYSNTPDDFSFLIKPISDFWKLFQTDFVIPLIHGIFGEDGQIQRILEDKNIPFLFSSSETCSEIFFKDRFLLLLQQNGFKIWENFLIQGNLEKLKELQKNYKEIVLKPNDGGSSRNVFISHSYDQSLKILKKFNSISFIAEPKHVGKEFSISICNGKAYIPVEIDNSGKIFDYRSKYFPAESVIIRNPPAFSLEIIQKIQTDTEKIFKLIKAKDGIRIDGWVLDNSEVIYTECNPISSTEFNGMFFQSIPENPKEFFIKLINNNLKNCNLPLIEITKHNKEKVPILFGGDSSEKEISLLSGCNACVKFQNSDKYEGIPFFLKDNIVYEIPLFMMFKHKTQDLFYCIKNIHFFNEITNKNIKIPSYTLTTFISKFNYIFLALHGGDGENGEIQKKLEKSNVKYNGSNSNISKLCMNKYLTIQTAEENIEELKKINRFLINFDKFNSLDLSNKDLLKMLELLKNNKFLILKPNCEGSSSSIFIIYNKTELLNLLESIKLIHNKITIRNNSFTLSKEKEFIIEEFIPTDKIKVVSKNNESILDFQDFYGWIELTIGTLKDKVFNPSITISEKDILTAEEKFQEGTGINLTPPPIFLINNSQTLRIKEIVLKIITNLQINTYCRIDFFYNRFTNEFILIEINTLPALTFSTVIFQQAIKQSIDPENFLEQII